MSTQKRVPQGVPQGGQFARAMKNEPVNVSLAPSGVAGHVRVRDRVTFTQPMTGSTTYEVVATRPAQVAEHDGTQAAWRDTGSTEYVLRDIKTGQETTSDLRQPGWSMAAPTQARTKTENFAMLAGLREGDRVAITRDGRTNEVTVQRSIGDQPGAWENKKVTVGYGPGRWNTEVSAAGISDGFYEVEVLP